jgi:hypothetical protein
VSVSLDVLNLTNSQSNQTGEKRLSTFAQASQQLGEFRT